MRNGPQYRFRGSAAPQPGQRSPIKASMAASESGGVATMRLYDPIDSWGGDWGVSAKEFAAALDEVPAASEIRLHINSPGGEVYEGIAILNALRNHPARVVAVVDGLAASAASFIATGADEVVMGRNTQLMVHDAWGLCVGAAVDMRSMAGTLDQISDNIASIYSAKAGGSVPGWRAVMLAETWYSADEAVAAGLADRVEGVEADEEQIAARFDLSMFKHQGRSDAPPPPLPVKVAPDKDSAAEALLRVGEAADKAAASVQRLSTIAARHRFNAKRHGLAVTPKAAVTADEGVIAQALGWFTAIDSIVDEAQEALAAHLGVPNPDADDVADATD